MRGVGGRGQRSVFRGPAAPGPRNHLQHREISVSKRFIALTAAAVAGAVLSQPVFAADISGAGATFPYPIYAKWADAYKKDTGIGLNYQSIGSGGGIKQIKEKTVTFGASDKPLPGKDLDEAGLAQFPMVMGGIVPVVNLEGIKPGELVSTARRWPTSSWATIKTWDDPAIKKLNPDAKLPSAAIAVVHRSDGSGTTYNFTYYLATVSADWKSKVGVETSVEWPVGIGAKGNEGVANNVAQTGWLDWLCRVCLRQAEQADPHRHDEQGRQAGEADVRGFRGGCFECRLERALLAMESSLPISRAPSPGR